MGVERERSRAYPAYPLQECVEWVNAVRSQLGSKGLSREAIAKALGSKSLNGASQRKIAAMMYFGLLARGDDGISLTSLSEGITKPISDEERSSAIIDAFYEPILYRDLLERFEPDGQVPQLLANILSRDFGIVDSVAESAGKVFMDSARYAGIVDSEGRIVQHLPEKGEKEEKPTGSQGGLGLDWLFPFKGSDKPTAADQAPMAAEQAFQLALTGGRRAFLKVPSDLTADDVKLIRAQIDVLELQAQIRQQNSDNS